MEQGRDDSPGVGALGIVGHCQLNHRFKQAPHV